MRALMPHAFQLHGMKQRVIARTNIPHTLAFRREEESVSAPLQRLQSHSFSIDNSFMVVVVCRKKRPNGSDRMGLAWLLCLLRLARCCCAYCKYVFMASINCFFVDLLCDSRLKRLPSFLGVVLYDAFRSVLGFG